MVKIGRMFLLLALALAVLSVTGCASSSALDEAQKSLAATTQRVGTLEEQLKASQVALTTAQGDLTKAQKDIATLTSDATTLKGALTATQSDVAATKKSVTSVGSDLSALENSSILTSADLAKVKDNLTKVQTDVTKLTTPNPQVQKASLAILALDLYYLTSETNTISAHKTAAARVGDVVTTHGDSTLSAAWKKLDDDWNKWVATTLNTPERDAAAKVWSDSENAFLLRLLQLIMG
ncbi:MAG: hypothetical protein Q7K03_05880 [Dehalococcoidia bacterium]|nr:hypothetical protein [Dehalococcoidia bacterium]